MTKNSYAQSPEKEEKGQIRTQFLKYKFNLDFLSVHVSPSPTLFTWFPALCNKEVTVSKLASLEGSGCSMPTSAGQTDRFTPLSTK